MFLVAATGFRMVAFVFPVFRDDPEEARFRVVAAAPVVFAALAVCRFMIALAPA